MRRRCGRLRVSCARRASRRPPSPSCSRTRTLGPSRAPRRRGRGGRGGLWAGELPEPKRLIPFDRGGTSADIGIVTERGVTEASARDTWVAGYPLLVPMIDIHTIGAGGGSIAYVDEGGAFRVGPRSGGGPPGAA